MAKTINFKFWLLIIGLVFIAAGVLSGFLEAKYYSCPTNIEGITLENCDYGYSPLLVLLRIGKLLLYLGSIFLVISVIFYTAFYVNKTIR